MKTGECEGCGKPTAPGTTVCWKCRTGLDEPAGDMGKKIWGDPVPVDEVSGEEIVKKAEKKRKSSSNKENVKPKPEKTAEKRENVNPNPENRQLTPFGEDRDKAIAKIAKEEHDRSFSRGKTRFGQLIRNQSKLDDKKIDEYLAAVAQTGTKAESARLVGISPAAVYKLEAESEQFQEMVGIAMRLWHDSIIADADYWARKGILVEEFNNKTGQVRVKRSRSEQIMKEMMKLARPELRSGGNQNMNIGINMPTIKLNFGKPEGKQDPKDRMIVIEQEMKEDGAKDS